ncbi:MAG: T9SS type A sorting domain-containing protein [Bacteroidota bacterium]
MIKKITLFLVLVFCLNTTLLDAQISCDYKLRLLDQFGDSWNGAALLLTINDGEPQAFFMTEQDGTEAIFPFIVTEGDSIQLEFFPGSFDSEVAFFLLDAEGNEIFDAGPSPDSGIIYEDVALCPACPSPPLSEINLDNIRAEFVDISWLAPDPNGAYLITYDTAGFNPDTLGITLSVMGDMARIGNLMEKTEYEFYIASACSNGDTSQMVGPIFFETVFKNDVGIIAIPSPSSACGLMSLEKVEVTLKNFGANPQTLIPFDFTINGNPGGVNMPFDGVFTGVLGKDSTFTIEFDVSAAVGEPDRYDIVAWTALESDSDLENDTFMVTVVSIPLIEEYPYFSGFEDGFDGWRVDEEESINSSWELGEPAFRELNRSASGSDAWVTNLDNAHNDDELSYLVSPCYDFSSLSEDPTVYFSFFMKAENRRDGGWLELSIDGGENWEKVDTNATATNWYNDLDNFWWTGNGRTNSSAPSDWIYASNTLIGAAGASDARLRFVFFSDESITQEGFGLDNIFVALPPQSDLSGIQVSNTTEEVCGEPRDEVEFVIKNMGTQAQRDFNISYQVNGGAIMTEVYTETLEPGITDTIIFQDPFNSSESDVYEILAWTSSSNDEFILNDTARFTFTIINDIPYFEDFESGTLPQGWSVTDETNPISAGHDAPSNVLTDNLWNTDPFFEASSPVIGIVETGDSLTFDYRYVTFSGFELTLTGGDSLVVFISKDCGENYDKVLKIDSTNHVPSTEMVTKIIYLDDYVGESIKIRFIGTWGSGDYFIDIDNISIIRCPESLDLSANVTDESRDGALDGSISIDPNAGFGPYTYEWETGETTKGLFMLESGTYNVTVSDAFGCTDDISVRVGTMTNTQDVEVLEHFSIAPNPTNGYSRLSATFSQITDVQLVVFNAVGQQVLQLPVQRIQELQYDLNLSDHESGLYFVQIRANDRVRTERLIYLKE